MQTLLRWIDALLLKVAILFFAGFLVGVSLQVFYRYVLRAPLPWSEELSIYLFVWSSFFTATIIVGRNEHFSIPFFVERLPGPARRTVEIIGTLLCMVFALIMIVKGSAWAWRMLPARSTILQVPQGSVYAVVPLAGLLMLLHLANRVAVLVSRPRAGGERPC